MILANLYNDQVAVCEFDPGHFFLSFKTSLFLLAPLITVKKPIQFIKIILIPNYFGKEGLFGSKLIYAKLAILATA